MGGSSIESPGTEPIEATADDHRRRTRRVRERVTRRRLLASSLGAGILGTAGSTAVGASTDEARASRRRAAGTTQDDVAELPLFDVHTHLIPDETLGREPLDADELVAWMDDAGIDRAVVLALDSPESYPVQVPSWWVLEEVAAYPERLVPFCTVDPRTLVYGEDTVEERLERYVDRGARGFGELKAGVPIDDERLETLYELCANYDLPILFHTDEKALMDEVGLPRLKDVLDSYPAVDFVAHSYAWWAHISADVESDDLGDRPEGSVEPGGRVPELLAEYDNIYGDISGLTGWNALIRDEEYGQEFLETYHEQLLFGTDFLSPGQEIPQLELFDRFDLEREAWADIRYRNLEGLLP